jgi:hypothetical protein
MRSLTKLLLLAALALLSGCHLRHTVRSDTACGLTIPYDKATSVAPLQAPEGLPPANTHNTLKVPEIPPNVVRTDPPRKTKTCLDLPPKFFADRPKPPPVPRLTPAPPAAATEPPAGASPAPAPAPVTATEPAPATPSAVPAAEPAATPAPAAAPETAPPGAAAPPKR